MVLKLCSNNGPISRQRFASFKLPWQNAIEKAQNISLRTKAGELQCCLQIKKRQCKKSGKVNFYFQLNFLLLKMKWVQ